MNSEGEFGIKLKLILEMKFIYHQIKILIRVINNKFFILLNIIKASEFNTLADIRLRNFTNCDLPELSLVAAGDLLLDHFNIIVKTNNNNLTIYNKLFTQVKENSRSSFQGHDS